MKDGMNIWKNCCSNRNAWIICLSCVIINYVKSNMVYSFGVFVAEFKKIYGTNMAELDWISVVVVALTDLLCPIPTLIIRRLKSKGYMICSFVGTLLLTVGCFASAAIDRVEWLFLTFSLTFGIGCSLIYMSSTLIINEFFPPKHHHHVMATSAFQISFPITTVVSCPLYSWIIKVTSWREAFAVGGVQIFLLGSICSLLFLIKKPVDNENGKIIEMDEIDDTEAKSEVDEFLDYRLLDICKTPERLLWLLGSTLLIAGQLGLVLNLPHYMENRGYDKMTASIPLISFSAFELIVIIFLILSGDKFKGRLVYFNIFSCLSFTTIYCIWALVDTSFTVIMILTSILGIIEATSLVYSYATTLEAMNMRADTAWTAYCFVTGSGSLLCPLLTGAVFDLTGSYDTVFYVMAFSCFASGLIFTGIPISQYCRKHKGEYDLLKQ